MIILANDALTELGDMELMDTSITTAASQTEYTVPVTAKRKVLRVQLQSVSDSNDNQWLDIRDYDIVPAAAGSTGLLIFALQPTSAYNVKLWYMGVHGTLNAYSDAVNETLAPDLVIKALLIKALEWRVAEKRGTDDFVMQQYNKAVNEFEHEKIELLPHPRGRQPRLLILESQDEDEEDHQDKYGPWIV